MPATQLSELERVLSMLASFGDMAERREQARAPKRPRRLSTSSSRRLQRIRRAQRRLALETSDGRLEVSISGRFEITDAARAALELLALADDIDHDVDPAARLVELLSQRS